MPLDSPVTNDAAGKAAEFTVRGCARSNGRAIDLFSSDRAGERASAALSGDFRFSTRRSDIQAGFVLILSHHARFDDITRARRATSKSAAESLGGEMSSRIARRRARASLSVSTDKSPSLPRNLLPCACRRWYPVYLFLRIIITRNSTGYSSTIFIINSTGQSSQFQSRKQLKLILELKSIEVFVNCCAQAHVGHIFLILFLIISVFSEGDASFLLSFLILQGQGVNSV